MATNVSFDSSSRSIQSSSSKFDLYDVTSLILDENDNWLRPEYPRYKADLAPAKPFLMPSFNHEIVEILPSEKQNRKINFDDNVYVMEIENRFQMLLPEEQVNEEEEVSYEIEIVEGGQTDDADFYLEMIDGEIFYVFETEDDISVEEQEADDSDNSSDEEDDESSNSDISGEESQAHVPMQLDIGGMMAPNLHDSYAHHDQYSDDEEDEDNEGDDHDKNDSNDTSDSQDDEEIKTTEVIVASETDNNNAITTPNNKDDSSEISKPSTPPPQSEVIVVSLDDDTVKVDNKAATIPSTPSTSPISLLDGEELEKPTSGETDPSVPASHTILSPISTDEIAQEKSNQTPPEVSTVQQEHVGAALDTAPSSELMQITKSATELSVLSPTKTLSVDVVDISSPMASVKSILKSFHPSPKVESPKKSRKERKASKEGKKQKTFTKTYVRADDFDGEHRVYSWEKPSWASNNKLRKSGKGDAILKGENLAQPITDTKQILKSGKIKWEKPEWAEDDDDGGKDHSSNEDVGAKEELIRKIQESGLNLPSKRKGGGRLKITLNGSTLREGSDIVKPITKATVIKKPSNVNTIANPKILRATQTGQKLKEGAALEAPTTAATTLKKYQFAKPSWTQLKLHSTQAGDILKKGGDVALAITPSTAIQNRSSHVDWKGKRGIGRQSSASVVLEESQRKEITWEKPSWAQGMKLRKTPAGDVVRAGTGDIAKPITNLPHMKSLHEASMTTATANTADNLSSNMHNGSSTHSSSISDELSVGDTSQHNPQSTQSSTSVDDPEQIFDRPPRPPRRHKMFSSADMIEDDGGFSSTVTTPRKRTPNDPTVKRSKSMD